MEPGGNLISNPDFEAGNSGWGFWGDGEVNAESARNGTGSVKAGPSETGFEHNAIDSGISEDTDYYIEAWGKADTGTNITVYIDCKDADGKTLTEFTIPAFSAQNYEKGSLNFKTPAGTTWLYVWTWKTGPGYAYPDDFLLKAGTSGE